MIAFLALLALQNFWLAARTETLTYSEFETLLKAGKVQEVVLAKDRIEDF